MTESDFKTGSGQKTRQYFWPGFAIVAVLFAGAAQLTWHKWPDVLVDFGTQLYIPWRILNGAILYRDLYYFAGGPFSQYFNALLFAIFGVSFSTLIAANLALTAAMIFFVYREFHRATDVWTAILICTGIVLGFAFGQYTLIGNYTYLAPYSHEALHGLLFSVFAIVLLAKWVKTSNPLAVCAAGFCAGVVFLTKADVFMALAAAIVAACVLFLQKHSGRKAAMSFAPFLATAAVPPLFFLILFLRKENLPDSLRSVLFGWAPLLHPGITRNPFYEWCLGLDNPMSHLGKIIVSSLAVASGVTFYAFLLRKIKRSNLKWTKSPVVPLLAVLPLLVWAVTFDWRQCGWPLPVLDLSACLLVLANYQRLSQPPVFPMLWSVFGLTFLAKLGLFPRVFHYGFVLAMPAFVSSIYLLFWLLPRVLEIRFQVPHRQLRLLIGAVILIGIGSLFDQSLLLYAKKSTTVGNGSDRIATYHSAKTAEINAALVWAEQKMTPGATLAVLPEGVSLNYLARRVNPTPCLFWDPNVMAVFGQAKMTDAFEAKPPDYIFIIQQDMSEFGAGNFGRSSNFGLAVMHWIQTHYRTVVLFGDDPLANGGFGIKILKHMPPPTPTH